MRFVLIHGGFHGAWCWDRVIPELERLGHEAIALDMPGHGERLGEEITFASRREALVPFIETGDVLVGHSGGGYDVTIAADAVTEKVAHVIYLAAGLPLEGRTIPQSMTMRPEGMEIDEEFIGGDAGGMLDKLAFAEDGSMTFATFEGAWEYFWHDCDEATARWAWDRLCPEPLWEAGTVAVSTPRFWETSLPRSYVLCLRDRSKPRWLSDVVTARLGVEPLTIDTSHSPFLSRPGELAEMFDRALATVPTGPLLPGLPSAVP